MTHEKPSSTYTLATPTNKKTSKECIALKEKFESNHWVLLEFAYQYATPKYTGYPSNKGRVRKLINERKPVASDQSRILQSMKQIGCETKGLYVYPIVS